MANAVLVKSATDAEALTLALSGHSKACTRCAEVKPIDKENYRLVKETRSDVPYVYFKEICRKCESAYTKKFNQSYLTPEKRKELNEKSRNNYDPEKNKDSCLRRNYGITSEDYKRMFALQGGLCAICYKPSTTLGRHGKIENLAVDHCHATGKVRGLLCSKCNRGLGLFNDDIPRIESAIAYIKRNLLWPTQ